MAPEAEDLSEPLLSEETRTEDDSNVEETSSTSSSFVKEELYEIAQLGLPLAVSFFCRMGMASTDSAFVGHIHDGDVSPATYLAAAVLSDMVLNVCITPPLAFNQVLNALVGQSMGSNNPKMAGVWLQQSMFWLSVSMLPCLAGLFYVEPILRLLDFPENVAIAAGTYAKYNLVWPIPNGLYQCMRFYFQAQGLPRPAMYNNMIFLFVNALLNWIFVFGGPFRHYWQGFGFIGAAISLSISRTMQGVVYFLYMFVYKQHHKATWPEHGWSFRNHSKERTMEFMKQALPNIGTLLFQSLAGQATTVLVGRLGKLSIAASSALSTVTIPWGGTLSATCSTVSGVRVGHHLGRGDGKAAKRSAWLVMHFITIANVIAAAIFLPFATSILTVATDEKSIVDMAATLVPAMLVSTYLNLLVSNITSGVFGGMGRPLIATILSFGLELPMSIGGLAIYIFCFHSPSLLGVYWWNAISGGLEAVIVIFIMGFSNWDQCADEAQRRQESSTLPESSSSVVPLLEGTEDNCSNDAASMNPESSTSLPDGLEHDDP
jgi:MATE family multidrug resistance protein